MYDVSTRSWRTIAGDAALLPTPRAGTSSVAFGHHVVVIGGESPAHEPAHSEVEAFDTRKLTWTTWRPLAQGRHGTGAIVVGKAIFTAAGSANRGGGPELDTIERWAR